MQHVNHLTVHRKPQVNRTGNLCVPTRSLVGPAGYGVVDVQRAENHFVRILLEQFPCSQINASDRGLHCRIRGELVRVHVVVLRREPEFVSAGGTGNLCGMPADVQVTAFRNIVGRGEIARLAWVCRRDLHGSGNVWFGFGKIDSGLQRVFPGRE
jgi:hypothetical protein